MMKYRYLTVPESVLMNAMRHMHNSGAHAAAGRLDHADGSAVKAARNFRLYLMMVAMVGMMVAGGASRRR
jgi:hypothetical protein